MLILFLLSNLYASNTDRAIESILKAGYYQYELDEKLDYLKDEYVNKDVEKYSGMAYTIIKITQDRKVTLKWKF